MGKLFSSATNFIVLIIIIAILFAAMQIWNWDPIGFLTSMIDKIANIFLGWEWFRNLVGAG